MSEIKAIEKPMLFSGPMVRAILEGHKTQTRRVMKPQPRPVGDRMMWRDFLVSSGDRPSIFCPHPVGSRIWVRESFSTHIRVMNSHLPLGYPDEAMGVHYWADGNPEYGDWTNPKPSIHMPRWASRITLEVTDVRVQRLQEITEDDAAAEGVHCFPSGLYRDYCGSDDMPVEFARTSFSTLWNSIKGTDAWEQNPWVWAYTFRPVLITPDPESEKSDE